jgi:hypothetical protein
MTKVDDRSASAAIKALFTESPDGLRAVIRAVLQEVLEAEMDEALGAAKGERTPERLGYRSGYYNRTLITRVGKLELRVPQGSAGAVLHRVVRALSALRACLGGYAGRDVCAGCLDTEGQGHHRGAVRSRLLGLCDLGNQQDVG